MIKKHIVLATLQPTTFLPTQKDDYDKGSFLADKRPLNIKRANSLIK